MKIKISSKFQYSFYYEVLNNAAGTYHSQKISLVNRPIKKILNTQKIISALLLSTIYFSDLITRYLPPKNIQQDLSKIKH